MGNKDNSSSLLIDIGQGLSLMIGLPRIDSWNASDRPERPKRGTFGFNTETSSLEYFNGDDWFTATMSKA